MNIVEQSARLIDPAAFEVYVSIPDESELDKTRRRYLQSKALHIASMILKAAANEPNLARQLADYEIKGWRDLNVPIDSPELIRAVEQKYGLNQLFARSEVFFD